MRAYVPTIVRDWLARGPEVRHRSVEGTLVFSDVSGFTPLSERLARKGKVGAEELTDVLNDVFGGLLDVATSFGGDLLKFGGDALLLLFTGDGHAARGAGAAASMQRALTQRSRIDTGSGIVRLRMSVGVHSGDVLLFLVGSSHRELLVTGPAASETVRMEATADAGEVLLSAATASSVPGPWLGADKDGGRLLRQTRAASASVAEPVAAMVHDHRRSEASVAVGVPASLREYLRAAPADGEHRQAVLSFLQFKGLEALLHEEGPSAVADALDALITACQRASERHDVTFLATDVDADGGKVLFSTGAPHAGANDADRMLQALREVLDTDLRLPIRAGVNRGPVFAVDVGASYRRTYAVMGDPTNLSARVMGKAPMGGMLATSAVIASLRTAFELTPREPFLVKGKSHPIDASEVGAVRGARTMPASRRLPFAGRDDETRLLAGAVAACRGGEGSTLAFVGPAGIGKSRLVEEARSLAGDLPVVTIEGGQYAIHNAYFALRAPLRRLLGCTVADPDQRVIEALQAVVGDRAPALLPWISLVDVVFGVIVADTPEVAALDAKFRRHRLAVVLAELLIALQPGPAVLVVEDAHWLDDSSSDVLLAIIEAVSPQWLVVLTSREEPGGLDLSRITPLLRRPVQPLDLETARELIYRALDDRPLPPTEVATIAERAAGNPLFLQELLAVAEAGGSLDDLPDSVEPLIAARLDLVAAQDRALLLAASVLGVRFSTTLLSGVTGRDAQDLADRLAELPSFVAIEGDGAARFRHALLREVAYGTLPFRRRRELHARAGEVLEAKATEGGERPVALMSLHFHAAERFEQSWTYSTAAAELAADNAAPVEATVLYQRALAAARHVGAIDPCRLADTALALGMQAELAGRYEDAAHALRSARSFAQGDPARWANVVIREGWLRERSRHYSDALRSYTRALRRLDRDVPDNLALRAEARMAYGATRLRQGRFREAVPWLEQAAADAERAGNAKTLAHTYYLLDWALTDLGDVTGAQRWRELALPIYEQLGDYAGQANVLNNLGIDAYYEGRWTEALELYERSRVAREKVGDVVQMGTASNNIGEILSDQGRLDVAEKLFHDARRIWRGSSFPMGDGAATSNLGRVASRAGRFAEARAYFDEALAIFRSIGAGAFLLDVEARQAEALVFAGEAEAGLASARSVSTRATGGGAGATAVIVAMAHRLAGYALAQLGRLDDAGGQLATSLAVAQRASAEFEVALTLEAMSRIGVRAGDQDAEVYAVAAGTILDRLGVVATTAVPLAPVVVTLT